METAGGPDPVAEKLERARRDLLDLSLRNTLINFTYLKSKGVRIVDELASEVFRILVAEGKPMSFLPARERFATEVDGPPESRDLEALMASVVQEESTQGPAARHTDTKLQTPFAPARLQRRLLNTYYASKQSLEEQGVNILYLALGMVHWFESESSDIERLAPIILIPVRIARADVHSRFEIAYTGDEIDTNLSLQLKLFTDFGRNLPSLPEGGEDLDVRAYFDAVERAFRGEERWSIDRDEIALGFFSFSKLLMYKDLDESKWPERRKPSSHGVLRGILEDGLHKESLQPGDEVPLDQRVDPAELNQVCDADSSQTLALLDVRAGRQLVIQGPPGTGKSQTITNLVADAIGGGKRVLFVSEKMAALDVVRRRLEEIGLGDACAEIHSHRTNKKSFLAELERTLDLGPPRQKEREASAAAFRKQRDRLNAYAEAVNDPIGDTAVTPHRAYGALLRLQEELEGLDLAALDPELVSTLPDDDYRRRRSVVEELQALLLRLGFPPEHPFWGSERRLFMPLTDQPKIQDGCRAALERLDALEGAAELLGDTLKLDPPADLKELDEFVRTGETALEAPALSHVAVRSAAWIDRADDLEQVFALGNRIKVIREGRGAPLLPEAWDVDVLTVRRGLSAYADKWWRFASSTYRSARRSMQGLFKSDPPSDPSELVGAADSILEVQRKSNELSLREELLGELFGRSWKGWSSDWRYFREVHTYLRDVHEECRSGALPEELLALLSGDWERDELKAQLEDARDAKSRYRGALDSVLELLEFSADVRFDGDYAEVPVTRHREILVQWRDRTPELQDMVRWNHLAQELRELDLGELVDVAARWRPADEHLASLMDLRRYTGLVEQALGDRPELARFDGETHLHVVETFAQLDRELLEANRAYLAMCHWEGLPSRTGTGQVGVLLREFQKKRRHLPIRQLMVRAGNAVQAIKPVFMMSPLSVAAYLPPGSVEFDLVVFDEASQVRPVDAFGAILRGEQAVVVGDSKQLPPTSFFDKFAEEEDEPEEWETATSDLESILGLFCAQGSHQCMLRWHYRSRHESLIAVSNHEFYDDKLFIFPSPDQTRQSIGLVFHHLETPSYERGKAINRAEAQVVARAVMNHAARRPDLTLGVAAFSMAQMHAIQDELELLRLQDPSCEGFFASHHAEPFFVKNLENVQGDERDVVFISVGYGRTEEGYLSMNFGPLNKDGGERRLNVLITRARRRCEVFSNLRADDIDTARTRARGVAAFKTFLKYAETGILDVPEPTNGEAESPFEDAVARALRRHGLKVDNQVGSKGFFVDLAIVDPRLPGRYVLGVECDGAAYHSAKWARDRDRLRQEVLESLGWEIHRIWSTDWFRNPERELRRTMERLEAALTRRPDEPPTTTAGPGSGPNGDPPIARAVPTPDPTGDPSGSVAPYRLASLSVSTSGRDLHDVSRPKLAQWIEDVVRVESPVHLSEAAARVAEAAGVQRVGSRIRSSIDDAAAYAARQGRIRRVGDFLWCPEMESAPVRDRSALGYASRKIEVVAPEELGEAVVLVVGASHGIEPSDAVVEACRLLGYARVTDNIRKPTEQVVRNLLAADRLKLEGEFLVVPRT